jgi:hypothetical protein
MELITNNPYRIAGILSNASERELQKQKTKIKAYAKVGKEIGSDYDFQVLDEITRTEDSIDNSFATIEQNQDKVNYTLFWFLYSGLLKYLLVTLAILLIATSCKPDNRSIAQKPAVNAISPKISHVTMYLENSGSMLGYVNGNTEFVNAINDLAQFPNLIVDNTDYSYALISGKKNAPLKKDELTEYNLGHDPSILKAQLTKKGYERKSSGKSDLTKIFEIALNKAHGDSISMLISDGIYDVGGAKSPLNDLKNEVASTRTSFIKKLEEDDIETLVIKLNSDFDGLYHPASLTVTTGKSEYIKKKRPYYIWVFGNKNLLKKYFSEERLKSLDGYVDVARFQKLTSKQLPHRGIGYQNFGFKLDFRDEPNTFELYKNFTNISSFNIAVDFSDLSVSDTYLTSTTNYSTSGNYNVEAIEAISVDPPSKLKPYIKTLSFKPTHIIKVVSNTKNPELGDLTISLNNLMPTWINDTNSDTDSPFDGNADKTFGFRYLIDGIDDAYNEKSQTKNIAEFKITIKK